MAYRSISGVLLGILLAAAPGTRAQERMPAASRVSDPAIEPAPGIRTDRLSPRQLRAWRAIEEMVFAKDGSGQFSHPKLHDLWQWVETSGHVIYVELGRPKGRWDIQAGWFKIERFDPEGQKLTAVIMLCLPVIDEALVRERIRPGDRFIQYEGLGRKERYAEVLGHELAHAVSILGNRSHARLLEALDREVEEFNNRRREAVHGVDWDEQAPQQLSRIESWTREIEMPARTAEAEVWQELRKSRETRSDASLLHRND